MLRPADAWPLSVAKHVDKVQIGRDQRLKRAIGHQGFDGAAPVAEAPESDRQTDTPPVHAQGLGAEDDLLLVDKPFGIGRAQKLPHLMGRGLPFF